MPSQYRRRLSDVVAGNANLTCNVPRCNTRRHGASHYCSLHRKRLARFGHVYGRRIRPSEFADERKAVQRLLAAHPDHQGVQVALEWLAGWMRDARDGQRGTPGMAQMARLARRGVTPAAILTECAALFLFSRNRPNALPDDGLALTFQLAAVVLALAPRDRVSKGWSPEQGETHSYRAPGKREREQVGNALRLKLVRLLLNVEQATRQHEQLRARADEALSDPFAHSTTISSNTTEKDIA